VTFPWPTVSHVRQLICFLYLFVLRTSETKALPLTDILLFYESRRAHAHALVFGREPFACLRAAPPKHQAERPRPSHTLLLPFPLLFFTTTRRTHCYCSPSAPRPRPLHPLSPSSREFSSRSRLVGDIPARAPIPSHRVRLPTTQVHAC
jgi:hypothetical protein